MLVEFLIRNLYLYFLKMWQVGQGPVHKDFIDHIDTNQHYELFLKMSTMFLQKNEFSKKWIYLDRQLVGLPAPTIWQYSYLFTCWFFPPSTLYICWMDWTKQTLVAMIWQASQKQDSLLQHSLQFGKWLSQSHSQWSSLSRTATLSLSSSITISHEELGNNYV